MRPWPLHFESRRRNRSISFKGRRYLGKDIRNGRGAKESSSLLIKNNWLQSLVKSGRKRRHRYRPKARKEDDSDEFDVGEGKRGKKKRVFND